MRHLLARLFGTARHSPPEPVTVAEEVSEQAGVLLVRLAAGSAMQVRPQPDGASVLIRIVPIAQATQVESDAIWQVASDSWLRTWVQSNSAIWHWLLAKGIDGEKILTQLAGGALPMPSSAMSLP
jgi:hypothetical protein